MSKKGAPMAMATSIARKALPEFPQIWRSKRKSRPKVVTRMPHFHQTSEVMPKIFSQA